MEITKVHRLRYSIIITTVKQTVINEYDYSNQKIAKNIITVPWYKLLETFTKNDFVFTSLPSFNIEYKLGCSRAISLEQSSSKT